MDKQKLSLLKIAQKSTMNIYDNSNDTNKKRILIL